MKSKPIERRCVQCVPICQRHKLHSHKTRVPVSGNLGRLNRGDLKGDLANVS